MSTFQHLQRAWPGLCWHRACKEQGFTQHTQLTTTTPKHSRKKAIQIRKYQVGFHKPYKVTKHYCNAAVLQLQLNPGQGLPGHKVVERALYYAEENIIVMQFNILLPKQYDLKEKQELLWHSRCILDKEILKYWQKFDSISSSLQY